MPATVITPELKRLIQDAKKAGKSSPEIARELLETRGIELDQRTISLAVAPKRIRVPGQSRTQDEAAEALLPHPPASPTLDEVEALEVEATYLQGLLAEALTTRDRVYVNAELRQTFAAIRAAKRAAREAAEVESSDTAWMVAKLKKFAGQEAPKDDAAPVSSQRDPAVGE